MASTASSAPGTSNEDFNKNMDRHPLGTSAALDAERTELLFTRRYSAAPAQLWAMLTEPAKTEMWWARVRGKAVAGSSFDLQWLNIKDQGHGIESDWWYGRVIAAQAPELLEFSNTMHGRIRVELQADGDGTLMTFRNTIEVPAEVVPMQLAGWHVHLDHLQEALEGKSVDWRHWWDDFYPCWEQVHARYAAM